MDANDRRWLQALADFGKYSTRRNIRLLASRIQRRLLAGRRGFDVNNFARAGVVQLLAGFSFNGVGIGLESLYLRGIAVVELLKVVYFFPQVLIFSTLLTVNDHAVRPEHHMHEHP